MFGWCIDLSNVHNKDNTSLAVHSFIVPVFSVYESLALLESHLILLAHTPEATHFYLKNDCLG